jgi:intraflagellar transport protein 122
VHSKVLCICWTIDGSLLAAGHYDGTITVRDKNGGDKLKIEASSSPVWTLAWNPQDQNVLATGCWDGMLKFYQISGAQKAKDRELGFDPCSLSYFGTGEYLTLGGTDRQALAAELHACCSVADNVVVGHAGRCSSSPRMGSPSHR